MEGQYRELLDKISSLPIECRKALVEFLKDNGLDSPDKDRDSMLGLVKGSLKDGGCPHCGSDACTRHGRYRKDDLRYKGIFRHKCNSCGRTFNDLTGTALHWLHYKAEFVEYVSKFLQGRSLATEAADHKVCVETAFNWRHKVCRAIAAVPKGDMSGEVEADPTYFAYSEKGGGVFRGFVPEITDKKDITNESKRDSLLPPTDPTPKKPTGGRKRGGLGGHPGIGLMQVGVMGSVDSQGGSGLVVMKRGKPTGVAVESALSPRLGGGGVEVLVTDSENVFGRLVRSLDLSHESINASKKEYVTESGFSLGRVGAFHGKLKKWMHRFNGVATKYLQHYMDYFSLFNTFGKEGQIWEILFYSNKVFIPIREIININCLKK